MTLREFLATTKKAILIRLESGLDPEVGEYDPYALEKVRKAKAIQMGGTVLSPDHVLFEFLLIEGEGQSVFTVKVLAPERIVFLPVPTWVIASVWQGEVDGSYHFENDAVHLVEQFRLKIEEVENASLFHSRQIIGRQ